MCVFSIMYSSLRVVHEAEGTVAKKKYIYIHLLAGQRKLFLDKSKLDILLQNVHTTQQFPEKTT